MNTLGEHEEGIHTQAAQGEGYDSEKTIGSGVPERAPEENEKVDVPPNGGIAWLYVGCVFLINGHTWGINSVCHSVPLLFNVIANSL